MTDAAVGPAAGSPAYWDQRYATAGETGVSWFEENPSTSLELIGRVADHHASVVDVGGGAGRLVDQLLLRGYRDVTVVAVSQRLRMAARPHLRCLARPGGISLPHRPGAAAGLLAPRPGERPTRRARRHRDIRGRWAGHVLGTSGGSLHGGRTADGHGRRVQASGRPTGAAHHPDRRAAALPVAAGRAHLRLDAPRRSYSSPCTTTRSSKASPSP